MMYGLPIFMSGHSILESQADELHAVPQAEHVLEQTAQPRDHFALARSWYPMQQVQQRLLCCSLLGVRKLLGKRMETKT